MGVVPVVDPAGHAKGTPLTSAVMLATPVGVTPAGAASTAVSVTVTFVLFHPALFGAGLTVGVVVGGTVSAVTQILVAVAVSVEPSTVAVAVIVSVPALVPV